MEISALDRRLDKNLASAKMEFRRLVDTADVRDVELWERMFEAKKNVLTASTMRNINLRVSHGMIKETLSQI